MHRTLELFSRYYIPMVLLHTDITARFIVTKLLANECMIDTGLDLVILLANNVNYTVLTS